MDLIHIRKAGNNELNNNSELVDYKDVFFIPIILLKWFLLPLLLIDLEKIFHNFVISIGK